MTNIRCRTHYHAAMDAFSRNAHYKPELARAQIKAGRFLSSVGDTETAQKLFGQAQMTLDQLSIRIDTSEMDEGRMSRMVRLWSR